MPAKKTKPPEPLGKKIKTVRQEKNISFDILANETGLTIDSLKSIESGETTPPVGTLLQIARALQIDSGYFLKKEQTKMKKRIKAYSQRTENYAYETLTPGAENKHLKAFKVQIEPLKDHRGVSYQHEGEEFVYVLKGTIEVIVGDHVNRLSPGDSLHFNSGIRHLLRNISEEQAELLVVIYGP